MTLLPHFEDVPPTSPTQRHLLHALLAESPQDRSALLRWVEQVDFERLDYASLRLVPALFKRFGGDVLCEPYHGRMKGIYRYFHYRTSLIAADAHKAIRALMASGVDVLVFKGLAIALKYHKNLAVRPMGDVDILIRREDMEMAEEILGGLGWTYRYAPAKKLRDVHSHDYINAHKSGLDLHWYVLSESPLPGIDDGLWERSEIVEWEGLRTRVLGREDLVLIAMLNAMREPDAMHCEWIFDAVAIIGERPGFDWDLLWQEAGRRGLRAATFDAMLLLHEFSPRLLSTAKLHALFESDDALAGEKVRTLVCENRTAILEHSDRARIRSLLASSAGDPRSWTAVLRGKSAYRRLVHDPSVAKYIRCDTDGMGRIKSLHLHRHTLPWLSQLFRLGGLKNPVRPLQRLFWREGWFSLRTGEMATLKHDTLPEYHARIEVPVKSKSLVVPAGEAGEVELVVVNDSAHCWFVRESSPALYGVSYHLQTIDGKMLAWDQPRTYFMNARSNHLSYVAPGQKLVCTMKIHAPREPGSYRLQLDVLQETVLWFSSQGALFPSIDLEVIE